MAIIARANVPNRDTSTLPNKTTKATIAARIPKATTPPRIDEKPVPIIL